MLVEITKTDSITCSRQAYFLVFQSQSIQIFVGRMFLSSQMIGEGFCFSMAGFFLVKQTNKQWFPLSQRREFHSAVKTADPPWGTCGKKQMSKKENH